MSGGDFITLNGVVLESYSPDHYLVELPNGHRLNGFPSRELKKNLKKSIENGKPVVLELTVYDLTRGRIASVV